MILRVNPERIPSRSKNPRTKNLFLYFFFSHHKVISFKVTFIKFKLNKFIFYHIHQIINKEFQLFRDFYKVWRACNQ
jgi:hypothetical protein